jgi:hypothetical protein
VGEEVRELQKISRREYFVCDPRFLVFKNNKPVKYKWISSVLNQSSHFRLDINTHNDQFFDFLYYSICLVLISTSSVRQSGKANSENQFYAS